jgi:hypothetical protein
MTEKEAIILLIYYNDWRRGEEIEMPNPTQIGIALDTIINEYFKREEQMSNKELLENFIQWLRQQDSLYILNESDEIIKKFLNEIKEK